MSQRIAIFEPNASGHRLWYVRQLRAAARAAGHDVILLTTEHAVGSEQFCEFLGDDATLRQSFVEREPSLHQLSLTAEKLGASRLYVLEGDKFLKSALAWPFSGPKLHIVVMRPYIASWHVKDVLNWIAKNLLFLFLLLHRNVDPMKLVDATTPSARLRSWHLPDAVSGEWTDASTWASVSMPPFTGATVATVGSITPRKNAVQIMRAVKNLDTSVRFVIAGKIADGVRMQLEAEYPHELTTGELVIIDRFLSDGELAWLVAHVDLLVLAYVNRGASGINARANQVGVRVLHATSSRLELLRQRRRSACGSVTSSMTVNGLSSGIVSALSMPRPSASEAPSRFERRLLSWVGHES